MKTTYPITLPTRQIHLDFHTSPLIPDVGKKFNGKQFAETLKKSHVNSVTCFARCHHGMLYYDSKLFPERVHPGLANKNLLKEMIEECHKVGIKVPIYTTVQWDHYTALEHPEWLSLDEHGAWIGQEPYQPGFYQTLCVNTGYRDFLKEHIKELFELFDVDGLFLDILYPVDCNCNVCRQKMKEAGVDVRNPKERIAYNQRMLNEFKREISALARSYKKDVTIFYNTSHIGVKQRPILDAYSHLELESIPGGWGYVHFPITMRYARTLGVDCVSHTGGFHVEWGDLHSFKTQEALEYECFRMLALGCKCLIGDQMEADGELIAPLYEKIEKVYRRVEELEPWCEDARPVTEIGVLTPEEYYGGDRGNLNSSLIGLENMFDKLALQFDILDSESDFGNYPLLVLPDNIPVDEKLHKKLNAYQAQGGKLLVTFESGFSLDKSEYCLTEETGIAKLKEPLKTEDGRLARGIIVNGNDYAEYILPGDKIGKCLPNVEHVMYAKGVEIEETDADTVVLNRFVPPYFYRNFEHFSSHRQAPSTHKPGAPAILQKGNVIYFASPVFAIYNARAPKWCLEMVRDAVELLLGDTVVEHDGPSTAFLSVNKQEEKQRYVLHILHYIPEKIAEDLHTVEDVVPLYDLRVRLRLPGKATGVSLVPEKTELSFTETEKGIEFVVPKVEGYSVVEIRYGE